MNEIDLAWAAGFFEGEGSLHIKKQVVKNREQLIAGTRITNTDLSVLRIFEELFDGHVNTSTPETDRTKFKWVWQTYRKDTLGSFLSAIKPFVRSQKYMDKILVVEEFLDTDPQDIFLREELFQEMKYLNKTGPVHARVDGVPKTLAPRKSRIA